MTAVASTADNLRMQAWLEVREPLERQLRPLGEAVVARLGLAPGQRVLDVGCGIGGTPHALARAIGPDGQVFAIDLLQAAVEHVVGEASLPPNAALVCGDAQSYPFAPGGFDAVFSRFGVMVFADPVAAFGNLRRALRPGGRLGFVSWRGLDDNELDALPLRAAAPHLPVSLVADAASAGWFSLSEDAAIRAVLSDAGFVDVALARHDQLVGSGDLQSMVDVCSRVGALGSLLRAHPELRALAVPALEAALRPLDGSAGPQLRAATWVVTARAPD